MLRIAVPNKGSLAETAAQMLWEAGYSGRRDPRDLHTADPRNGVEFFYLRPRDIATYVGSGALDVGITGRDLLLDSGSMPPRSLRWIRDSTFRFAGPAGAFTSSQSSRAFAWRPAIRASSATSWPVTGSPRTLVKLDGAVESAVRLGVATRSPTSSRRGRRCARRASRSSDPSSSSPRRVLIGSGVEQARHGDARASPAGRARCAASTSSSTTTCPLVHLERATEAAPGFESPTVSPLHDPEWVAVRVMIPRVDMNHVMDELYSLGAAAILVSAIHAARL
jgi:ATP phosphoribosyltransferase